jgi:hypothetical protein
MQETIQDSKRKEKQGHPADDAKCPIHPHSNHMWGNCHANAFSKANHINNTNSKLTLKQR